MEDLYYGNLRLRVHVEPMGEDLCVTISGGDRPHIGSVAIAEPRESLRRDGTRSATVSTYNVVGHKDGEIADEVAQALASRLARRCVVLCGVHYERAKPELIEQVREAARDMVEKIAAGL